MLRVHSKPDEESRELRTKKRGQIRGLGLSVKRPDHKVCLRTRRVGVPNKRIRDHGKRPVVVLAVGGVKQSLEFRHPLGATGYGDTPNWAGTSSHYMERDRVDI